MSNFALSRMSDDNWATPKELYAVLDAEFHFDDDPCPLDPNVTVDGLAREWGQVCFMNPPYSDPTPWVRRAYEESLKGKIVVGLLRGDTSTRWFHDWVLGKAELRFIKGRLRFNESKPAPFASIIAVWDGSRIGTSTSTPSRTARPPWRDGHEIRR
jgi:site-specific DNA-methyltransferase (adenine-specific)